MNIDVVEPENFRIKIAATHVEPGIDQPSRQCSFTGGYVKNRTSRKWFEDANYRIVYGFVGQGRSLAIRFTLGS